MRYSIWITLLQTTKIVWEWQIHLSGKSLMEQRKHSVGPSDVLMKAHIISMKQLVFVPRFCISSKLRNCLNESMTGIKIWRTQTRRNVKWQDWERSWHCSILRLTYTVSAYLPENPSEYTIIKQSLLYTTWYILMWRERLHTFMFWWNKCCCPVKCLGICTTNVKFLLLPEPTPTATQATHYIQG